MTLGPGAVVSDRYELIRMLGGGAASGRVYLAFDRHLEREVALRVVERDPRAAAVLLGDGRRMSAVHAHTPAAVAVLDAGELPDGGAYTAAELIPGTSLDEVARHRAPLPVAEAVGHGIALLDASIAARRNAGDGSDPVVASALVTPDGTLRVTRFADGAGAARTGSEPSVAATGAAVRDLLAGSEPPPAIRAAIDDALAGRVRSAEELRGRLLAAVGETPPAVIPPPPPVEHRSSRWPWAVAALVALLLIAGAFLLLRDDGDTTPVPETAGQTAAQAVAILQDAGFTARTAGQADATVARGVVIGTAPAAGTDAPSGSEVVVNVSQGTGEAVVPALAGVTRDAAEEQLEQAGLTGRYLEAESATAPAGTVISQDPAAGLRIPAGSVVAVTVSSGPPATTTTAPAAVAVPDLEGLTVDDAAAELARVGLRPGGVTQEARPGVAAGTVLAQDPGAGTQVAAGTAVDVVIASAATTTP